MDLSNFLDDSEERTDTLTPNCQMAMEEVQDWAEYIISKCIELMSYYSALPEGTPNSLLVVVCPTLLFNLMHKEYDLQIKQKLLLLAEIIDWSDEINLEEEEVCCICYHQEVIGNMVKQTRMKGK